MKTKREKATITASFSALARICGEDMLRSVLKARGKRKGSSIIIPGSVLLPVLSEAAKWRWERKNGKGRKKHRSQLSIQSNLQS